MKAPEKHTHKLKKLVHKSGTVIFFCVLDCSYKISSALALGKSCICWRCGEKFLMNEYSLRLSKPHCESCHKPKKSVLPGSEIPWIHEPSEIEKIATVETLSLAERLQQTLNQKLQHEEEEGEI